ncbi:MAG: hypothetical protein ACYC35_24850 [Pirellulales bacterium]
MRGGWIVCKSCSTAGRRFPSIRRFPLEYQPKRETIFDGIDGQRIKAKSLREQLPAQGEYDLDRILLLGVVPPAELVKVLSAGDLHIYLMAPFVLSWSLMDAPTCGCTVLAADTAPLRMDHESTRARRRQPERLEA